MVRAVHPAWRQSAGARAAEGARAARPGHRFIRRRAPRRPHGGPPRPRTRPLEGVEPGVAEAAADEAAAACPAGATVPPEPTVSGCRRAAVQGRGAPVARGHLTLSATGPTGPRANVVGIHAARRAGGLGGTVAPPPLVFPSARTEHRVRWSDRAGPPRRPAGAADRHPVGSRDGHGVREVGSIGALPESTDPLPAAPTRLHGPSTGRQATLHRSGATAGRAAGAAVTRVAVRTRYVVRLGSTTGSPSVILPLACSASHSAVGSAE